ncbi:hypothetical protein RB195_025581 [Necator americanus]|uniref:C-type lectin domain-containing protein n=1 Tax=Necator americanus TaxID=51031 RepID=A0ABR1ET49_NECAM
MRLLVLLLLQFDIGVYACPCEGVVVAEADQDHCWEVRSRAASTWVDADLECQRIGGHLGYPQGDSVNKIYEYIILLTLQDYTKPVLTNILTGSVEAQLYAIMCPNNQYYGLLPKNTTFFQNATDTNACAYFTKQSDKLSFESCTIDANVLCDRPMEKVDYCNIMMNCTTTTTTISTSTLTTKLLLSNTTTTRNLTSTTTSTSTKTIVNAGNLTDTTSTTTTTKTIAPQNPQNPTPCSSSSKSSCGPHEWSIFGWCADWRLLLVLTAILLSIFLLICLLHCCCHLCNEPCQEKEKKEKKIKEEKDEKKKKEKDLPILMPIETSSKKLPEPPPENKRYDVEQSGTILPPPATVTQPVFVPIPVHDRRESLIKEVEREVRMVCPPKPETADIGVNTDPWPSVKKRKTKKADKIQVRRPPVVHSPLVEVDGDLGDDISLNLERWNSAETVLPKGDIEDNAPLVFIRNPKPQRTLNDLPLITSVSPVKEEDQKPLKDVKPQSTTAPRRFRSPPPTDDLPVSVEERKTNPPAKDKSKTGRESRREKRPLVVPLDNDPPQKSAKESVPSGGRSPGKRSANSLSATESNGSASSPTPPRGNVSMRNPRGRMGGAVRAGGGGGASPVGWKPWSNGASHLSQPPQFLSGD